VKKIHSKIHFYIGFVHTLHVTGSDCPPVVVIVYHEHIDVRYRGITRQI